MVASLFCWITVQVHAQQPSAAASSSRQSTDVGSSTATATSRIDERQLVGLPLNGRSYSSLATLQAGVSQTSEGTGSRGTSSGGLTVAGGRSTSNTFLMDGTNIMGQDNTVPRSAAGVQLGSDAVLQVQVFSNTYGAEYGRESGGVLNSITRSGTPAIHGSLFEYFRNSKLDARDFFDNGLEPPPFKRNQFGFIVTGPIQKDRTYFSANFEAMRDRLNQTDTNFVPDELARTGTIVRSNGQVDHMDVNPVVKPYLALYPLPNLGSIGDGVGEVRAPHFLPTDENFFTVRVDHQFSQRDSLFARYTFDDASSNSSEDTYLFTTLTKSRQQFLTVANTQIFSLATVNTFRFGYTRPVPDTTTIPGIQIPRKLYFVADAPDFGSLVVVGLSSFGPVTFNPQHKGETTFQFSDDLLLQRGKHGLKLGVVFDRYHWDVSSNRYRNGEWSFNSLDSFLQAGPEQNSTLRVSLPGSNSAKDYRQSLVGLYVQDEMKVRPALQVTLGLRYEVVSVVHDAAGHDSYMTDPFRDTQVQVGPLLGSNPSLKNFAPRLGITWTPTHQGDFVVSAGFGVFYDQVLEYLIDRHKTTLPYYKLVVRQNFRAADYFPDAVAGGQGAPPGARILDHNALTSPMVLRYNLTVQETLPANIRLQASYVGARGNRLLRTYENNLLPNPVRQADGSLLFPPYALGGPDNRVNPAFGSVEVTNSDAQSFYNALQIAASKNVGRSFSLQASYAFSKSVDDSSVITPDAVQFGWQRTGERGPSDFDIRHRLSVSYFYNLPNGPQNASGMGPRILREMFGAWRLGGIVSARNGTPFTAQINVRRPGYLFSALRPNLNPGRSNNPVLGGPDLYFDPSAFAVPAAGFLGNLGRNTLISPSVFAMDVSLQKDFRLDARMHLQFRAESFNLLNHSNLGKPSATVYSGSSGRLTSTVGKIRAMATTARQMQFALRLSF
jgi:TonB-dependent receptor-like protein